MKYTTERINKGIVFTFGKQAGIAHTAEEAEQLINGFRYDLRSEDRTLEVNRFTKEFLQKIFAGEEVGSKIKTNNCGKWEVRFYPAMADTIEEHNRLYGEACERRKAEFRTAKEQRLAALEAEWNQPRKGWYRVTVEVTALSIDCTRRRYLDLSAECLADSRMNAYNKFVPAELERMCIENELTLESFGSWYDAQVEYLGTRTDDDYRAESEYRVEDTETGNAVFYEGSSALEAVKAALEAMDGEDGFEEVDIYKDGERIYCGATDSKEDLFGLLSTQETVGDNIAAARHAAGLSQQDLADKTGLRQATIADIELSKSDCRISTLQTIAVALDCNIADLFE